MRHDRWLAGVSAAQLAAGVAGMAVAVRRRHACDTPVLHGSSQHVARDSIVIGTALSAPVVMLVAQGGAVVWLVAGAPGPADRVLGGLGLAMSAGYLGEALVRRRLRRSGYDRLESPLVVVGIGLAGAMAAFGLTARRGHAVGPVAIA